MDSVFRKFGRRNAFFASLVVYPLFIIIKENKAASKNRPYSGQFEVKADYRPIRLSLSLLLLSHLR